MLSSDYSFNLKAMRVPKKHQAVAYGAGRFIMIDSVRAYSSTDGVSWTIVYEDLLAGFSTVAYCNGFVIMGGVSGAVTSTDGITWTKASGNTIPFARIVSYAGVYVGFAVPQNFMSSEFANLYHSTDAITWTQIDLTALSLDGGLPLAMAEIGGAFVVVVSNGYSGGSSTNLVITSTDGVTWTVASSNLASFDAQGFYDGLWDGSQFVVVGSNATIVTSPDGTTWTQRTSADLSAPLYDTTYLYNIVYGDGIYLTFGSSNGVFQSTDSINWTLTLPSLFGGLSPYSKVAAFGAAMFVIVILGGSNYITTTDGVAFTFNQPPILNMIRFQSGSTFFGATATTFYHSDDNGQSWVSQPVLASTNGGSSVDGITDIQWLNSQYVVVTVQGNIYTSPDGVTWTLRNATGVLLSSVAASGSVYVAAGSGNAVYTSSDGVSWASSATTTNCNGNVSYVNSLFILGNGAIFTSTDGVTWTERLSSFASSKISNAVYDGTTFIVSSTQESPAMIATSTDGVSWTITTLSAFFNILSLAVIGSTIIAVSHFSVIAYSTDHGVTWTNTVAGYETSGGTTIAVSSSIALMNGYFSVPLLSSSDGILWYVVGNVDAVSCMAYGNSIYVAMGAYSAQTSSDGVTWTDQVYLTDLDWTAITFANGVFISVGGYGVMSTSTDGINWTWVPWISGADQWSDQTQYQLTSVVGDGSGTVVATGYQTYGADPLLLTSTDNGVTWAAQTVPDASDGPLGDVTYGNSLFLALFNSLQTTYLTSADGISWTANTFPVINTVQTSFMFVSFNNGVFLAIGDTTGVQYSDNYYTLAGLTSTDTVDWSPITLAVGVDLESFIASSMVYTNDDMLLCQLQATNYYAVAPDKQNLQVIGSCQLFVNNGTLVSINDTIYSVGNGSIVVFQR